MEGTIRKIAKWGFWGALLLLLTLALLPSRVAPQLPGDKVQHFAGFLVVSLLGFGWVKKQRWMLVGALAAVGAAIELLQAMPVFGRDGDALDWAADFAGIIFALAVVKGVDSIGRRNGSRSKCQRKTAVSTNARSKAIDLPTQSGE